MKKSLTIPDLFSIIKKRKYLFCGIIITGIILITIYSIFKFPPKTLSTRIFSGELGNIFGLINKTKNFLTPDDINKLIKPISKTKRGQGIKYQLGIKNTFKKENTYNSTVNVLDLVISRKFSKNETNIEKLFRNDLKDFFTKLDRELFLWFSYELKIEKIEVEQKIFNTQQKIEKENNKLKLLEKYLNVPVDNYKDTLDLKSSFLPPNQQYYGLQIEQGNRIAGLVQLNELLVELTGTLELITKTKNSTFNEFVYMDELKGHKECYARVKSIYENLNVLVDKYILKTYFQVKTISVRYFIFCGLFLLLVFSIIFIVFAEWVSEIKNNLS